MKYEQPKAELSIQSTISEIKKAESEKEVENAIEEFEKEAVAGAVVDEMPIQEEKRDDAKKTNETELIIEEIGINFNAQERKEAKKKLIEYIEKINKYGSAYINPYEYFEPSGSSGRSYDEEMDLFMKKREDDKNYCPTFEYQGIDNLNLKKLNNDKKELIKLKKEINLEKSDNLKIICFNAIENIENKIGLIENIKDRNYNQAFEYAIKSYGDINDELFNISKKIYDESITKKEKVEKHLLPKEEQIKIDMRKKIKEAKFDAEDYKNYFEIFIRNAGFKKYDWEVIITSEKKILTVMSSSKDYDHPVVLIPEKYNKEKKGGLRFIKDLNHEFTHIITQTYNQKNGFGGVSFGANYETFTEGLAMLAEKEMDSGLVNQNITNKEKNKMEISAQPYYTLGMKKVKEGANFAKLFDYLLELKREELKLKKEDNIEEKAIKVVKVYCKRIFRGFNPDEGGKYFPKDKAYLEGEIGAKKMEENGLADYLYKSKADPVLVPYLIKLGTYTLNKELKDIKKVVVEIFRNKNWQSDYILNKEYFDNNTMKDRDWAYKKQFMNENMTRLKGNG